MNPRVSVVIPLYNKAKYISRALGSVAHQTFSGLETIVVDDGSLDGGGELAANFPDRRIRVIRQRNGGPGAARNRGLEEAAGEFVAFLDADDSWSPEYLASALAVFENRGDAASVTSAYTEGDGDRSQFEMWRRRGMVDGPQRVTPNLSARRLAHMVAYMTPCTTVARTEVVRRWGGFYSRDGCRYGEDAALWLKVLLNERVWFQLRPLVNIDRSASELGGNFRGPRPVEPYLLDPKDIERACPVELRPLLDRFYCRAACKTATVLGVWGEWARARQLVKRFVRVAGADPVLLAPALLACTPLAGVLGRALRPVVAGGQSRRGFLRNKLA